MIPDNGPDSLGLPRGMRTPLYQENPPLIVDQQAQQLDDLLSQANLQGLVGPLEHPGDAMQAGLLHQSTLGDHHHTKAGMIQLAMPYFGWYRVAIDDGGGVLPCCLLYNETATALSGSRSTTVLPAGTRVLVHTDKRRLTGLILGVIPDLTTHGSFTFSDNVVQGSGVGVRQAGPYFEYLTKTADQGGVSDFSNHQPIDQTQLDWGRMTPLGGGVHVDPFLVYLRIDEACGVFGHYIDQALQVRGYNLDIDSAACSEWYRDDQDETSCFRGETLYAWEGRGAMHHETFGLSRETEDTDVIFEQPYGKIEPAFDDQQAFFRYQEFGGYLGQGHIRQVAVPAARPLGTAIQQYFHDDLKHNGVFREQISINGGWAVESAKRVVIAKRSLIPIPKQVRRPEDYSDDGDNEVNYKSTGYDTEQQQAAYELNEPDGIGESRDLLTSSAVLDVHAWVFNWQHLHAFHYHQGDWYLPEEADMALTTNQVLPPFGSLTTGMWMSPPEPILMEIDHRQQLASYYQTTSHLTMSDDGSVVLQGGAGEEIKMAGGNILFSCPGHIILQPGKGIIMLAGDDVVVRAKNSIDITTSDKDVRIKAQRNLQVLAANSGEGVLSLESRQSGGRVHEYPATGGEDIKGSGIIFKAPQTQIAAMGQEIYLRTGSQEGGIGGGDVIIDADQGQGDIRTISRNFRRHIGNQSIDAYGIPTVRTVNIANSGRTLLGASLDIDGSLRSTSFGVFRQSVTSTSGHFSSRQGGPVGQLQDAGQQQQALQAGIEGPVAAGRQLVQTDFRESVQQDLYGDGRIGNPVVQKDVSFSLRNEDQYGTRSFQLPLAHWQILAENSQSTTVWQEKDVTYQGSEQQKQMPWPGRKKWAEEATLLVLGAEDLHLHDLAAGRAKNRSDEYNSAQLGPFRKKKPQEAYTVIDCF